MKTTLIGVASVLSIALASPPSFAQTVDSCGGGCPKLPSKARSVSALAMTPATFPGNTLSATLAKGKKKTILMAEGVLTDAPYALGGPVRVYGLGSTVNGIQMQPAGGSAEVMEDCGSNVGTGPVGCTVTGHWWLDLDDPANAALLGVPVSVNLFGGDLSGSNTFLVDMSLRVRLENK